ncbi:MAG: hypothetical protein MUO19_06100 [Dehalococcoidales bacterium]|nr:hypothetical protein [Dehalococcoidales bacterium]
MDMGIIYPGEHRPAFEIYHLGSCTGYRSGIIVTANPDYPFTLYRNGLGDKKRIIDRNDPAVYKDQICRPQSFNVLPGIHEYLQISQSLGFSIILIETWPLSLRNR